LQINAAPQPIAELAERSSSSKCNKDCTAVRKEWSVLVLLFPPLLMTEVRHGRMEKQAC
jgi:hypothetical protein